MTADTHELAWAAGLFDGEGHIAFRRGRRLTIREGRRICSTFILDIRQIDTRVLTRFKEAVGVGNVVGPYRSKNKNSKPFWAYQCSKFEHGQAIVAALWKWLSPVKRNQAATAIIAWVSTPRCISGRKRTSQCKNGHGWTPENTYWNKQGKRVCTICRLINGRIKRQTDPSRYRGPYRDLKHNANYA